MPVPARHFNARARREWQACGTDGFTRPKCRLSWTWASGRIDISAHPRLDTSPHSWPGCPGHPDRESRSIRDCRVEPHDDKVY